MRLQDYRNYHDKDSLKQWIRWFYKSRWWKQKRRDILKRNNYECQRCKEQGKFSPATNIHHIKPLEAHPELALDDDNLISLCAACHNKVHPEKFPSVANSPKRNLPPERW